MNAWLSRTALPAILIGSLGLALSACEQNSASADGNDAMMVNGLKTAAAFTTITDDQARAEALFDEMFKVIAHPRCMNCHPRSDQPTQGDMMVAHQPPVFRGPDGHGMPGMECETCHGADNVAYLGSEGSIPGHEPWHLAPLSMGWQGMTATEICEQLKDNSRNGGMTLNQIHVHHAEDGLVGWGWHPGEGRTPAPGDQKTFGELTRAWIDAGAHCPSA